MTAPISNQPSQSQVTDKSFGQGTTQKAYGAAGGGVDPALAQWYEQAYVYYQEWANQVAQGQFPPELANPQAWNEFLNQMEWAASQLGLAGGQQNVDPGQGYQASYQQQSGIPQNPNGIPSGPGGQNYIANMAKNELNFYGDNSANYPTDVWGDFTLNVAQQDASVDVSMGVHPKTGETVMIIKVTSPALGKEAVYYVHDTDAEIKVNMADQSKFNSSANIASPVILGEFKPNTGGKGKAGDQPDRMEDEVGIYEEKASVNLSPRDGEDTENEIYANKKVSIDTKPTSEVTVENSADGEWITVTVKNGDETDVYKIKKYEGQIIDFPNASPDQITGLDENSIEDLQQKGDVENAVTITLDGTAAVAEAQYEDTVEARARTLAHILGSSVKEEDILANEEIMAILSSEDFSEETWAAVAVLYIKLSPNFTGSKQNRMNQALEFFNSGVLENLEDGNYDIETVLSAANLASEMGLTENYEALAELFTDGVMNALKFPEIQPPNQEFVDFLIEYDETLNAYINANGVQDDSLSFGARKNDIKRVYERLAELLNTAFPDADYTASEYGIDIEFRRYQVDFSHNNKIIFDEGV